MPREAWGAVQVVAKLPKNVAELIVRMTTIVKSMRARPDLFPEPPVGYDAVDAHVETLSQAHAATQQMPAGNIGARNQALLAVRRDARQLETYVNIRANSDRSHASLYADAAGMFLRKFGGRVVPDIAFKQLRVGVVRVTARTMRGAKAYEWDLSVDRGATWTRVPGTTRARCTLEDLSGKLITVRVRGITKHGVTDWVTSAAFAVS